MNADELARSLVERHGSDALNVALDVVRRVAGLYVTQRREVTVGQHAYADAIVQATCEHFSVLERDLRGITRRHSVVRARKAVMALLRWRLHWSYEEIGAYLSRDHSTVLREVQKADMHSSDVHAICTRLDTGAEAAE